MKFDFHYCCIKALAQRAGFSAKDAQLIAYASQYTDDAVENEPLHVTGLPDVAGLRLKKGLLDPICTAHKVLLSNWKEIRRTWTLRKDATKLDSQKKVYVPFHFLPPQAKVAGKDFDFVVKPNGELANMLVKTAVDYLNQTTKADRDRGLIKLGLAVHTFADNWSHQGFSGRYSEKENDLKNPDSIEPKFDWKDMVASLASVTVPEVGHSQAGDLPDLGYVSKWTYKYKYKKANGFSPRNNGAIYLDAAEKIYTIFNQVTVRKSEAAPWDDIRDDISACLTHQYSVWDDRDEKKRAILAPWKQTFDGITFSYNPHFWRTKALKLVGSGNHDFESWEKEDYEKTKFAFNQDSNNGNNMYFLYFHAEAKLHRQFSLDNVPL